MVKIDLKNIEKDLKELGLLELTYLERSLNREIDNRIKKLRLNKKYWGEK